MNCIIAPQNHKINFLHTFYKNRLSRFKIKTDLSFVAKLLGWIKLVLKMIT